MRVEQLGIGTPEYAVIGAVHGDEPCGARAIEGLLDDPPAVEKPVKLIIVNEAALAQNCRYIDEDLNRAFPGSRDAPTHEGRIAHDLLTEVRDCVTLSLHSTQSHAKPFAIVHEVDALAEGIVPYLSIDALVEATDLTEGRLGEHATVIEVECGIQGSDAAAANAERVAREFLGAVGVTEDPNQPVREDPVPIYRLTEEIPKRASGTHEVLVQNFERVAEGDVYATTDGEPFRADQPFYPVLLSPYGYEDVFGYAADLVGRLGDATVLRTEHDDVP